MSRDIYNSAIYELDIPDISCENLPQSPCNNNFTMLSTSALDGHPRPNLNILGLCLRPGRLYRQVDKSRSCETRERQSGKELNGHFEIPGHPP